MSVQKQLKELERERNKKERFLKTSMWFSTFISMLYPDRVTIPKNIGNRVFIGNNMTVTKNHISQYIIIKELSENCPTALASKITKKVKTQVEDVKIDFRIVSKPMIINLKDGGLESRRKQWKRTLSNPVASKRVKKRCARLLYTYDLVESGEQLRKTWVYIIVRAQNGEKLNMAMKETTDYLTKLGIKHKVIKSKLEEHMKLFSLLTSRIPTRIKDIFHTVQTNLTIAELLSAIQGSNDSNGVALGINRRNRSLYYSDFKATAAAKNIAIYAPSGKGKTYMIISWLIDFFAQGFRLCVSDIKGNELTPLVRAIGGLVLPVRSDSKKFVNTLVMNKAHIETDELTYYTARFKMTVELMKIVANLPPSLDSKVEAICSKFLQHFYTVQGIAADNQNSWSRSAKFHPHQLAAEFRTFCSAQIKQAYGDIIPLMQERFDMYFNQKGSHAYMFLEEFNFDEIYDAPAIAFDFGILDSVANPDPVTFKIRYLSKRAVESEYTRYNKSKKYWTAKVQEEAQYADDYAMKDYADSFALGRSQNVVNILACNSITAIKDKPLARPIIDNTNILVIGGVSASARDYLTKEYSLDEHTVTMSKLEKDVEYENTFLLVNRMTAKSTTALVKIYNPDSVSKGKLYKVVDTSA